VFQVNEGLWAAALGGQKDLAGHTPQCGAKHEAWGWEPGWTLAPASHGSGELSIGNWCGSDRIDHPLISVIETAGDAQVDEISARDPTDPLASVSKPSPQAKPKDRPHFCDRATGLVDHHSHTQDRSSSRAFVEYITCGFPLRTHISQVALPSGRLFIQYLISPIAVPPNR